MFVLLIDLEFFLILFNVKYQLIGIQLVSYIIKSIIQNIFKLFWIFV